MASDRYVEHESPWLPNDRYSEQECPWLHAAIPSHAAQPAAPGITVTDEMIAAAQTVHKGADVINAWADFAAIYRAMAAVAPEELYRPEERRIDALVAAANQQWHATWSATEWQRQEAVARVAELEAENAELKATTEANVEALLKAGAYIATLGAEIKAAKATTTFGDPTPADLPAPPRRPDGTLAPQPKPFPVLKTASGSRRVGG